MKEIKLPISHPRSWYARRSYLVTVVFFKKLVSLGISPAAILVAPRVGEEAVIASLFAPESCPESSALADGATGATGAWTVVSAIEQWIMKAMEDEKVRARNDGVQWVQWRPALCGWQAMGRWFFPKKKVTFRFNRPCNPDADATSRGVGNSKGFEIRGILEKEPWPTGRTSYQADRHSYLPKIKIESSAQMSDWVNNGSARSAGTKMSEPEH
jgi:hypothetical protein